MVGQRSESERPRPPRSDAYPRPQLRRPRWLSLNGIWEFAIDVSGHADAADRIAWERRICVPFSPESTASGVGDQGLFKACWYRRDFEAPTLTPGERLLLHFGAVDYQATVWFNGIHVADHVGGYTPFSVDLTRLLSPSGPQELVVRAFDDPHDLAKPRGKQDWLADPHAIWYPRTSGIWQTVWLERVGESSIANLTWTSSLERWEISLHASIDGPPRDDLRLRARLHVGDLLLADDTYLVVAGEVHRRVALSDPGIDDSRNELLWSPESPTLIQVELQLLDGTNQILDCAQSYTALRSARVRGDRFLLNGRPYRLRMVLDQGYWPETGLTAPTDEALRADVELAKRMGFNGVRKHQKLEDPRYLYWADVLGLLVWEEMPSAYRFTYEAVERLTTEWTAAIQRDRSHPCVVAWVPINESWGVPDLTDIAAQRHFVQALYHLTHTLDGERPVVGNDGWEALATDIIGIHDYDTDLGRIAKRYASTEAIPRLFHAERPGGRSLTIEGHSHAGQPIMLTEFGGIALASDTANTWGYSVAHTAEELTMAYQQLTELVASLPLLGGYCYTQFSDTYQEANGLLYADRTPKLPLDDVSRFNRDVLSTRETQLQFLWEERMRRFRREQHVAAADRAWVEASDFYD